MRGTGGGASRGATRLGLVAGLIAGLVCAPAPAATQGGRVPLFTTDFEPGEFAARRAAVYDALGPDAIAVLQGAPIPVGYTRFRQTAEFFYLTGIETPGAYVVLNGAERRATLYLPHRWERRVQIYGEILTADDADQVRALSGLDAVLPVSHLTEDLAWMATRSAAYGGPRLEAVYTPFHPAEAAGTSRWWAARSNAEIAADPWDGRPSRDQRFLELLRQRLPTVDLRDLTPVTDSLRLIKSPAEITLLRRAAELAGHALLESMRSTRAGVYEYEIDALARFIFLRHGAQGEAYRAIVATGENAFHPHYHAGTGRLEDGQLVLMDAAPDMGYYTSDVTRMWPVSGRWEPWQRELYGFYLACYEAILHNIRPGVTGLDVHRAAARDAERILAGTRFSRPEYERAARGFVAQLTRAADDPAAGLSVSHYVGMGTHDVGGRVTGPFRPGMVFVIEPALVVPEERIYIRLEDPILITDTGAESLIEFVPRDMEEIERIMAEDGLLQQFPRLPVTPRRGDPGG